MNDNLISELTTNEDGEATYDEFKQNGKYYLKEIKAPEGYDLNEEKYEFELNDSNTLEITLEDNKIVIKKEEPKKVIVKKSVKKLPSNFEPKEINGYIYGNIPKQKVEKEIITKEVEINDDIFSKDDYKLLLKLLTKQKERVRQEKEENKIEELQELYRSVR